MSAGEWTAVIAIRRPEAASSARLERVLLPEASREVPRARARLVRRGDRVLELHVAALDTGALRAALNTYLGWVALADATERVAAAGAPGA